MNSIIPRSPEIKNLTILLLLSFDYITDIVYLLNFQELRIPRPFNDCALNATNAGNIMGLCNSVTIGEATSTTNLDITYGSQTDSYHNFGYCNKCESLCNSGGWRKWGDQYHGEICDAASWINIYVDALLGACILKEVARLIMLIIYLFHNPICCQVKTPRYFKYIMHSPTMLLIYWAPDIRSMFQKTEESFELGLEGKWNVILNMAEDVCVLVVPFWYLYRGGEMDAITILTLFSSLLLLITWLTIISLEFIRINSIALKRLKSNLMGITDCDELELIESENGTITQIKSRMHDLEQRVSGLEALLKIDR